MPGASRFPLVVATIATLLGCRPDPPPVTPTLLSGAEDAAPAEGAAPVQSRWGVEAPNLEDLHAAWDDSLTVSDAAVWEEFRARRADRPADPLRLPTLPAAEPGGANEPAERCLTQTRYCRRALSIWKEEIAAFAATRPLREDELGLLTAMADLGDCDGKATADRLARQAAEVRAAGADQPVVRAHFAWETVRLAPAGDMRRADLAELCEAADATVADELLPGLFRYRPALWAFRGALIAEQDGFAEDEVGPGIAAVPINPKARFEAAVAGLRAFAKSVTPEAAAARPQLPRLLYHHAWDLLTNFDADQPEDAAPRRAIVAALSDAALTGGDPYAFHVILCEFFRDAGSDARGTAFSNRVTEAGWRGMSRNMTAAGRHGHAAWLAHPNLPCAAAILEGVARGDGSPLGEREWFAEAVAAQVDYRPAHASLRTGLLPRWGGSHAEMISLAQDCLREDLSETDAPWEGYDLLKAVWDDAEDGYGPPPRGPWRKTLAAYADHFVASLGDEPLAVGSPTDVWPVRMGALCRALDEEGMSAPLLAMLRTWPAEENTQMRPLLDGYRRAFVAGPLIAAEGDAAQAAARLAAVHPDAPILTHDEVLALQEDVAVVRAAAKGDALTLGWLEDVDLTLDLLDELYRGEIRGCFFRPGLPGWRCGASWFEVEPGENEEDEHPRGMVDLSGDGRRFPPYLSFLAKLPEPFTLTADFHVDPSHVRQGDYVGIGLGEGVWSRGGRNNPATVAAPGVSTGGMMYVSPAAAPGELDAFGWLPYPWINGLGMRDARGARGMPPGREWINVGVMAEPGRVATFAGMHFVVEEPEAAPERPQPVRLGPDGLRRTPVRWRIRKVIIKHSPGFKAPVYTRNVPDHLRGEPEEEDAEA